MPKSELSEPFLRALLQSLDQGIHAIDRRGVTIFYNHIAAELDGLAPEEVLGRHLLEVFPSLTGGMSTLLRAIDTGRPVYNEQQTFTNFKGHRVTTINSTLPIYLAGDLVGALEVSKDVTRVRELSEQILDLEAALGGPAPAGARRRGRTRHPHRARYAFSDLIGADPAWLATLDQARRAAGAEANILVYGETGTGKELVVQAVHHASPRRRGPFIAQNCAALPAALLEGLLFGTVRGAFTGAEDRPGLFELAAGGTLLLDEINSMPLELQPKLLRTLQERTVRRVGDMVERPADVRVIATTNADPHQAVDAGQLRRDLLHRLQVVYLELPPLRARGDDLDRLLAHFLLKHWPAAGSSGPGPRPPSRPADALAPAAMAALRAHDWPGNVRELEHALQGALALAYPGPIELSHLPPPLSGPPRRWAAEPVPPPQPAEPAASWPGSRPEAPAAGPPFGAGSGLRRHTATMERQLIRDALQRTGGNLSATARDLAIPRQTLQYRLRKHGLDPAAFKDKPAGRR